MCGIAGGVWTEPHWAVPADVLDRMTDVLMHRGPDDRGTRRESWRTAAARVTWPEAHEPCGVALGMRRLSIIDRAGGHQPLSNEDGTIWLVFNGEIYNYRELRRRLEGKGHRLATQSDTETIVHLYEDHGPECLQHLNGMFALALWDGRTRQLLLARDRLGKKPLVYRHEAGRLLFASELKSLLEAPRVPRTIDAEALDAYLTYQYVPHPRTIFQGVSKLPPGCYALWRDGQLEVRPYWRPALELERPLAEEEYARQLRQLLSEAVELRLEAEVPLGAFLSGGIDSSIIVGLMQQLRQDRVRTFSIGFPVKEFDETSYAREVAAHLGTDHRELRVEASAVEVIDELAWIYDEPFADSSAIPTYFVSKLTREHVTVALTGDGGDELFAGYPRYRAVRWGERWDHLAPEWRQRILGLPWQRLPAGGGQRSIPRRLRRLCEGLAADAEHRYFDWVSIFSEQRRGTLYRPEWLERLGDDPFRFLQGCFERVQGRDRVTAASLTDLLSYLPCDLLTKVDLASMANSLECRCPFLDYRVVELAAAMPVGLKLRGGTDKWILKHVFADLLPRRVRRRGKMGFGVPLAHWFRHELRERVAENLLDPAARCYGQFQLSAVRQLWEEHQARRFDHSARLWALWMWELWQRRWLGG